MKLHKTKFRSNPMQELGEGGGVGPVQPWRIRRANADCTIFGFPLYRFPFCLFIILWKYPTSVYQ